MTCAAQAWTVANLLAPHRLDAGPPPSALPWSPPPTPSSPRCRRHPAIAVSGPRPHPPTSVCFPTWCCNGPPRVHHGVRGGVKAANGPDWGARVPQGAAGDGQAPPPRRGRRRAAAANGAVQVPHACAGVRVTLLRRRVAVGGRGGPGGGAATGARAGCPCGQPWACAPCACGRSAFVKTLLCAPCGG